MTLPPAARLPDALALAIDAAMTEVRALLADGDPDRATAGAIRSVLAGVAMRSDLFEPAAFPVDPHSRDAIYLLSEDPDQRLALYLAVRDAPLNTPVHDHTTWAAIVGVRGNEHNRFFERRPGGGLRQTATADIGPGEGVAMLAADLHAIATDAGVLNMQLHLYGRSFDAQGGRVTIDPDSGVERRFAGHPGIRVPAGRVTAATLRRMTRDGGELAVVDLREVAAHAELGHPLVAVSLPAARLQSEAARCFPNRDARIVLLDDDGLGPAARIGLEAAGYRAVHLLAGGCSAWVQAGYPLFTGLNVPGKAFGEFIDHTAPPPRIEAAALADRRRAGERMLLLDCRTPAEHHRMTLEGSVNVPGAELPARIRALAPDPSVPVVVHCAGRTRGIVAARMLIDAGCPNPVAVLENGLIGWLLAGGALEIGGGRAMPQALAPLPGEPAVAGIDAGTLARWLAQSDRTTYVFDIRSAAEFTAGHLPGAVHVPGGELLQQLEARVPVRRARVVIAGDDLRARSVACLLARMDWAAEAVVLTGAFEQVAGAADTPPALPRGWRPPFDEHEQDPVRMQAYIDWELALLEHVEADSTVCFR